MKSPIHEQINDVRKLRRMLREAIKGMVERGVDAPTHPYYAVLKGMRKELVDVDDELMGLYGEMTRQNG